MSALVAVPTPTATPVPLRAGPAQATTVPSAPHKRVGTAPSALAAATQGAARAGQTAVEGEGIAVPDPSAALSFPIRDHDDVMIAHAARRGRVTVTDGETGLSVPAVLISWRPHRMQRGKRRRTYVARVDLGGWQRTLPLNRFDIEVAP